MRSTISLGIVLLIGMFLGAAIAAGAFYYLNRRTTVLTARESISVEGGIVLPKGTQLIHDSSMSEGFETLRLYVNVSTSDLPQHFERRHEKRAFLIVPYWIR
jgi:hypothetical protein